HAREVAAAPGVARRELDRLARERTRRDLEGLSRLALEHEQAFLGSNEKLSHSSSSRNRRDHRQPVQLADSSVLPSVVPVDEDVHVLADQSVLVEDPASDARMLALERLQYLRHRRALELQLSPSACQLRQRSREPHDSHASTLDRITA